MAVIHHWPLTANAIDIVGGITTTNNGGVTFSSDNGASFNGINQWLNFTKLISLTTAFSISAWVKFSTTSQTASPFGLGDTATNNAAMLYSSSGVSLAAYSGENPVTVGGDFVVTNYPPNRHVLCTMTCNGSKLLRLYRDNLLIGQGTGSGLYPLTNSYWSIGRLGIRNNFFLSGYILDAQFDDAERSLTEVASMSANGPNGGAIYSPIFVGG